MTVTTKCALCRLPKPTPHLDPKDKKKKVCAGCYAIARILFSQSSKQKVPKKRISKGEAKAKQKADVGPCAECEEPKLLRNNHTDISKGRVCNRCFKKLKEITGNCAKCSEVKKLYYNYPNDSRRGKVCKKCYLLLTYPTAKCPCCKETKLLSYKDGETKVQICIGCYQKQNGKFGFCGECEKEKKLRSMHPLSPEKGRVCGNCLNHLTTPTGDCAECEETLPLQYNHPNPTKGRICSGCYKKLNISEEKCSICTIEKKLPYRHPERRNKNDTRKICANCRYQFHKGSSEEIRQAS